MMKAISGKTLHRKKLVVVWMEGFAQELVSKELNHLAAILQHYARGVDFYEVKNIIIQKEK